MSLSQYELAQIVEALDTIRKRLDDLEAAQTDAFHVAQLVYLEQQRWQEMAEDLWEELQEWHSENCGQASDGTPNGSPCACHNLLAARWDELTHSDDWADGADV